MANPSTQPLSSPIVPFPGIVIVEPHVPDMMKYMENTEAQQQDQLGLVLAVGDADVSIYHPEVKITTPAKVGDVVFHTPQYHAPYKDLYTGKEYKLVRFTDLKGVLTPRKEEDATS